MSYQVHHSHDGADSIDATFSTMGGAQGFTESEHERTHDAYSVTDGQRKPHLVLDRNNAGTMYIGVDEFGSDGMGVRSYVLSMADPYTADSVMVRRFQDMVRLMGNNVTYTDHIPYRTLNT